MVQERKGYYNGYCCLCKVDIKCDNAGKAQLLQHAKRKKHTEVIKHMQSVKQSKLLFSHSQASSSSQGGPSSCQSEHGEATQEQSLSTFKSSSVATLSGFVYYDDASLKAGIYWLAKVACSNYSLCSCDHVGDMFRAMFPDSKIAAHFSLSHTSSSYIISEGLSSYFTKVIIDDLQRSKLPFSIDFDETSTSQVKKQMDLTLRYWSPTHEKVWTVFYTSLFSGHATADIVSENMYHKMCEDGIPVDRICILVRDGPNVNKAIF